MHAAVDCDIHPTLPGLPALLPYLDEPWRESVDQRGLDELTTTLYPRHAPLTHRPDWRAKGGGLPALRAQILDPLGIGTAICNCLYGVTLLFSEDLAAALATAVNRWIAAEWLDKDSRLRASILVAPQNPAYAVEEIERCAADPRFVQVLLPVSDEIPLGRRPYWPIYEAAARHRLPVGIHAGGTGKHPPTPVGWPSYVAEEYAGQPAAFQGALTSLICEGALTKFPDLTIVLLESGVTWLPAHLWRLTKFWRGLRLEVPWLNRPPAEIVRAQVRLTAQPFDAPADPAIVARLLDQLGADDMLLFATDWPHFQYDGEDPLPPGLPPALATRLMVDNPRATYQRLRETVA